jgi:rare lipoprotein A
VVTINDRGPFIKGRVLDLSKGAARVIGLTSRGVGHVTAEVIS